MKTIPKPPCLNYYIVADSSPQGGLYTGFLLGTLRVSQPSAVVIIIRPHQSDCSAHMLPTLMHGDLEQLDIRR